MAPLSLPQLSYLQTSLASATPIRPDSRSLTQFRPISYASSILPGCLGSVHLTWGPFSIIVGVKGQVVSAARPSVHFHIDVQGGRDDDVLTASLSDSIAELIKSGIDSRELQVVHGRAWELSIDAILLSRGDSNPLPAMSLAVRLAMLDTRLPLTTPTETDEGVASLDFDVDDDYGKATPIKSAANLPLLTLINHIGSNIIFDASSEEEAVLTARYLMGVTETGTISFIRHVEVPAAREGIQGRDQKRGIAEEDIRRGVQEGLDVSKALFKTLRAHIEEPISLFETL